MVNRTVNTEPRLVKLWVNINARNKISELTIFENEERLLKIIRVASSA